MSDQFFGGLLAFVILWGTLYGLLAAARSWGMIGIAIASFIVALLVIWGVHVYERDRR
jgi:tetrahydromethanopterin S-methyltransferase subunit E